MYGCLGVLSMQDGSQEPSKPDSGRGRVEPYQRGLVTCKCTAENSGGVKALIK